MARVQIQCHRYSGQTRGRAVLILVYLFSFPVPWPLSCCLERNARIEWLLTNILFSASTPSLESFSMPRLLVFAKLYLLLSSSFSEVSIQSFIAGNLQMYSLLMKLSFNIIYNFLCFQSHCNSTWR